MIVCDACDSFIFNAIMFIKTAEAVNSVAIPSIHTMLKHGAGSNLLPYQPDAVPQPHDPYTISRNAASVEKIHEFSLQRDKPMKIFIPQRRILLNTRNFCFSFDIRHLMFDIHYSKIACLFEYRISNTE